MRAFKLGNILFLLLALACGNKKKSSKKEISSVLPKAEIAFTSMKKEELMTYLPAMNEFEKKGDPSGEDAHVGASGNKYYSYARQYYEKDKQSYSVEIIDYKDDTATLSGLQNMYGFNTDSIRTAEFISYVENIQIDKVRCVVTKYTNEPQGRLVAAVNNRFLVIVNATGSTDIKPLKELAENAGLAELSKLN